MKKRVFAIGGILVAAGLAGGVGWYYLNGSSQSAAGSDVVYVSTVSSIVGNEAGVMNRYAGVVEAQQTVEITLESGRKVSEVNVKEGQEVKAGQLLFEYDLSSIEEDIQETQLELDRLKNEALSLQEQITTLEKEKKNATKDNQLSYTIEIETNKMNLKKNEYDQQSKQAQLEKLQSATANTEVRSEIDGIIQKIDTSKISTDEELGVNDSLDEGYSYSSDYGETSTAFITILSTGAYRIKGTINEQNISDLITGEPMLVRSRVDESLIWRGTMGEIDRDSATSSGEENWAYFGMTSMSDSQTSSSSYPFYIDLESSDGLMLGQHVYIEKDNGQEDEKEGLWLSEFYIVDADETDPYVWAAGADKKLEKRTVILGQYDEELGEYEIVDGLTMKDCIAFPTEALEEGMSTTTSSAAQQFSEDSVSDVVDMESSDESMILDDSMIEDDSMMYEESMMEDMDMPDEEVMTDEAVMYEEDMAYEDFEIIDEEEVYDFTDEELMPVTEGEMGMDAATEAVE